VHVRWLGYYNIAGTFLLLPSSCTEGIGHATAHLRDAVARSLSAGVELVDTTRSWGEGPSYFNHSTR